MDPTGTDVLFFGFGAAAFISKSPGPESKRGYAASSSIGIAFDTKTRKLRLYKSTGKADPCRGDVVQGAGLGAGLILGQLKGDMEDFFGWARERTTHILLSVTTIETESGKKGIAVGGGGKGIGIGYTSIDTYTSPLF